MKFEIDRGRLERALTPVVSVVEKKDMLPILANVLIRRDDAGNMEIVGTDLELQCRHEISGVSGESGAVTVNARRLFDVVRQGGGDQVSVDVSGQQARLKCGSSVYRLNTMPVTEYPEVNDLDDQSSPTRLLRIDVERLKRLVNKVSHAMAQNDTRIYLCGMLLDVNGGDVSCVSSDGHRLVTASSTLSDSEQEDSDFEGRVILPRKAVQELAKLTNDGEGDFVEIRIGENTATFGLGPTSYVTKLVEGTFPEYRAVVAQQLPVEVLANRADFAALVRRAVAIVGGDRQGTGGQFTISSSELQLDASNAEGENFHADMPIEADGIAGETRLGFNLAYIGEALRHIEQESATMYIRDETTCCIFRSEEGPDTLAYVVMPMRI